MSDPNPKKKMRELEQARNFLRGAAISYARLECGTDPPDVLVLRDGASAIGVEVTEYHPGEHVSVQARWAQFLATLDDRRRENPALKTIRFGLSFHDALMPPRRHHAAIVNEVVRFAEFILHAGWDRAGSLKFSFLKLGTRRSDIIEPGWWAFDADEWPLLAKHVNMLTMKAFPITYDFLPSECFQAQVAWCSPTPDSIGSVLQKKENDVLGAIRRGDYIPGSFPLWLLVVANNPDDISSFAFGSEWLEDAIDGSDFDFEGSVFQEVWMSEGCGHWRAMRLYSRDRH